MTEAEELELLELENENAATQARSPMPQGWLSGLQERGYRVVQDEGGQSFIEPKPTVLGDLATRFGAGLAQRSVPQPKGADVGDVAEFIGREGGPVIGAGIGVGLGTPLGPAGIVAGGALGAAAGRMGQKAAVAGLNAAARFAGVPQLAPDEPLSDAAKDSIATGAMQGIFGMLGKAGGLAMNTKTAQAIGEKLAASGGNLLQVATKVPGRIGAAAIANVKKFAEAPTADTIKAGYDEFYGALSKAVGSTVSGRREFYTAAGKFQGQPATIIAEIEGAVEKLRAGQLGIQDAINASQGARVLRDLRREGASEVNRFIAEQADTFKDQIDDYIETWVSKNRPDLGGQWQNLREATFWRHVRDAFTGFAPKNKNLQPDSLRGTLSGLAAASSVLQGQAGGLFIPVLQSPGVYGLALHGANAVMNAAPVAGRATSATIADYYNRPAPQPRYQP